jgi:hypothetical protein
VYQAAVALTAKPEFIVDQQKKAKGKGRKDKIESMAYSLDFRKQAIAYMDRGHTFAELKEAFNIFLSALNAWRRLLKKQSRKNIIR